MVKIAVYGAPLLARDGPGLPPWWVFVAAIPWSMLGTTAGGLVLDRVSDYSFKRWTGWTVTAIGALYLVKAGQAWQ